MRNISIAIILSVSAFLSSCCKEGLDGKATVTAFPEHHERAIYGATVYIKFGAKDQPASLDDYDASFTAAAGDSVVVIEDLRCGDYYFYSTGFDPLVGKPVIGGTTYTIRYGDRKQQIDVTIPVTDEH